MLEMTAPLSAAIHNADIVQFEKVGHEQLGKNSLEHRALDLVLKGRTTVSEAMTVVTSTDL
jgi:type II secretory ATPase GspE/PulE/Tfp pilus assembly ATPase PilB-like protein